MNMPLSGMPEPEDHPKGIWMQPLETYWHDILSVVRRAVQQQTYDTWFLPLQPLGTLGDGTISVPNHFFLDWFSEHHLPTLNDAASRCLGQRVEFKLEVNQEPTGEALFKPPVDDPDGLAVATIDTIIEERATVDEAAARANLNREYQFENFVVSGGTDLAFAAATAVADKPGTYYNPLFIHGGVGLGKTHLMHAIGLSIAMSDPAAKICYLTAETFMNELIAESLINPNDLLFNDYSILENVFNPGSSKGVMFTYLRKRFSLNLGYSDGLRTGFAEIGSPQRADFAVTLRTQYGWGERGLSGFNRLVARRGTPLGIRLGASVHYQDGGRSEGTTNVKVALGTIDLSVRGSGWSLLCSATAGQDAPANANALTESFEVVSGAVSLSRFLSTDSAFSSLAGSRDAFQPFISARSLAGRANEGARKQVRQRRMIIPEAEQTLQQIGAPQKAPTSC